MNKILLTLVIVLFLVLVGLFFGRGLFTSSWTAVYLQSGDLYFGRLIHFPHYGLTHVYLFQVDKNSTQTPVSVQKFTKVFWGPQDFLSLNRNQVVWTTTLDPQGQLAKLLDTNPDLTSGASAPTPVPGLPTSPVTTTTPLQ